MSYRFVLSDSIKQCLAEIWQLPVPDDILAVTPFGDFFAQSENGRFLFYSLTDGEIRDVTTEVKEHGLPPVDIALGDEWYQLGAQQMLEEEGWALKDDHCFGFIKPVFAGGDYGPDNLEIVEICQYSCRIHGLMNKNRP